MLKSVNNTVIEIARILNHSKQGIYWVRAINNNIREKPKCGRQLDTSVQFDRKIESLVSKQNVSIRQVQQISVAISQKTQYTDA